MALASSAELAPELELAVWTGVVVGLGGAGFATGSGMLGFLAGTGGAA